MLAIAAFEVSGRQPKCLAYTHIFHEWFMIVSKNYAFTLPPFLYPPLSTHSPLCLACSMTHLDQKRWMLVPLPGGRERKRERESERQSERDRTRASPW